MEGKGKESKKWDCQGVRTAIIIKIEQRGRNHYRKGGVASER